MNTSRSFWLRVVLPSLALSVPACGSRSDLDLPADGTSKSGTNSGGQRSLTGGSNAYYTLPLAGGTWGSGGLKATTGGTPHYGGTWSAGGTTPRQSSGAGGTTPRQSSGAGGTAPRQSSGAGGTAPRQSSAASGSSNGGTTYTGGTWSMGGTPHTFTSSVGTTSTSSSGGHSATGGVSAIGGFSSGGTRVTGGTSSTGGASAFPWTSVCSSGLTECGMDAGVMCVDAQTDANNCGFCGHACESGWHCYAGQCRAPVCTGEMTFGPALFDAQYNSSTSLNSMIIADFNHDGLLDFAVEDSEYNLVGVRLGDHKGQFGPLVSYLTGYNPQNLAAADFNGDGKLDLVTVNSSDQGGVSVLLGNGDGTFASHKDFALSNQISHVAVGDLNGDTIADLVTDSATSYGLQVFIGIGDGTFAAPAPYSTGVYISSIALGDVNGDSRLDVIASNTSNGSVMVRLGNGNGTLGKASDYSVGSDYPQALAVGDVNGDHNLDVVVASTYPNLVAVMLGDGTGTLTSSLTYTTAGVAGATLGDLNRDGKLDIVLLEPDPSGAVGNVGVRLCLGTGAFGKEVLYPFSTRAASPAVGDFDEDGLPDVAAVDASNGAMVVLFGKGDGTLYDSVRYPILNCPNSVTLGDTNRDGTLDLISANGYSSFDVYFGPIQGLQKPNASYGVSSSRVILGDLDWDGQVDLITYVPYNSDPFSVLFGAGGGKFSTQVDIPGAPSSVAIADVDHDGWQDLVSLDSSAYTVSVNRNLGHRTFAASEVLLSASNIYDFAIGDLNGDQLPDLVLTTGHGLQVALATAPGTYASPVSYGVTAESAKLTDVNGDHKLDVLAVDYGTISVLLGKGDGTLGIEHDYAQANIGAVAVDDVNGDGNVDIVIAMNPNTVGFLIGNGDGTFSVAPDSGYAWGAGFIAVGDLNGDGWPDLTVQDTSSSPCQVSVLYGKCR